MELENANKLLMAMKSKGPALTDEELVGFSPTAAAAVNMIRSGLTLTEMYTSEFYFFLSQEILLRLFIY